MADDIDIEEHDVLDNPRIKNIFPGLTRVKIEAPDMEDEETMLLQFNYENHEPLRDAFRFEESEVEYTRSNNKIILGRKPCASSDNLSASNSSHNIQIGDPSALIFGNHLTHTIKYEPVDVEDVDDMEHDDYRNPSPVIILGSKPVQGRTAETDDENDIKDSVVSLEDWGPRLQRSSCYCKDCEILFPTRNCLDFHNSTAHSFLVALNSDRAVKKKFKNTARKSTMPYLRTPKAIVCNHCNKKFPDDTALIKHLYELMHSDKFECDRCEAEFHIEAELNAHMETHDDSLTESASDNGTYYRCNVCSCYFDRKKIYIRHMLGHAVTAPSFEKLPFNGRCLFCNSGFNSTLKYNYNRHIQRAHRNVYYDNGKNVHAALATKASLKTGSKVKLVGKKPTKFTKNTVHSSKLQKTVSQTSKLPQHTSQNTRILNIPPELILYKYKCFVCHETLKSHYSAKKHKAGKHPEHKNHNIFQKILVRKHGQEVSGKLDHTTDPITEDLPSQLVPRDMLFKCDHCQIHFTSCSIAVLHSRNCLQKKGDWKCQQCQRTFKFKDIFIHQHQHAISERFNVYAVEENLYGKVLCQCPYCDLYFHEQDFWAHFKQGCRPTRPVNCKTCDIPMHVSSLDEHNKWHRKTKISRNGSILIEFHVRTSDDPADMGKSVKRKMTGEVSENPSKKAKLQVIKKLKAEKIMFYCTICKCCIIGRKYIKYHYKGQCKISPKIAKICTYCGLVTSSPRHPDLHKGNKRMKIGDYRYVRIQDNKPINPPIPAYPKCGECNVHFITTVAREKHDCNDGSKTCRYCKQKFSDLAYKLHVPFHEYRPPGKATQGVASKSTTTPQTARIPEETQNIDQQLLKNYLLLTESWNIMLYLCEVCNIVCDSYDKMVEHSQNHFSHMESYGVTVKNCQKCDLNFDSTCFEKHREMHNINKAVNKNSFQIFTYNYTNLLTDDWYILFGDLPKAQIDRIVSQSIYKYSRTVKMRVIKNGPQGHTLYKCGQCDKYVNPLTLAQHYSYASCSKINGKYKCSVCHIVFSSTSGRNNHALVHKTNKNKTFRTVLINEDNDEEFNAAMRSDSEKSHVQSSVKGNAKKTPAMKSVLERKYIFYLCKLCGCCIRSRDSMKRHVCSRSTQIRQCPQCDLWFRAAKIYKHEFLHETLPSFERKNMRIVRFDPKNGDNLKRESNSVPEEKVAKIYKCRCGLHFVSSKTAHHHLEVCSPKNKISKENCSQCGLLFPTNALVSHLCSHHSNVKFTRFEVEKVAPDQEEANEADDSNMDKVNGIYKCIPCNCYFLTISALKSHFKRKHIPRYKIKRCSLCKLKFSIVSLKKHVEYHHKKFNCKLKDMHIIAYDASMNIADVKGSSRSENIQPSKLSRRVDSTKYNKNLYKCIPCNSYFLTLNGLLSHFSRETHKNRDTSLCVKCNLCGLSFNGHSLMKHIKLHHQKLKLTLKQFRIVAPKVRDNKEDVTTSVGNSVGRNLKISTPVGLPRKSMGFLEKEQEDESSSTLYKCLECDVHYISKKGFYDHLRRHQRIKNPTSCTVCGLMFSSHGVQHHIYFHHRKANMKQEDFLIESSWPTNVTSAQDQDTASTIASSDKDLQTAGDLTEVDVSTASVIDEGKEPNKIENWFERVLYKCDKCPLNFLTSSALENHKYKMEHDLTKIECDTCHLMFTTNSLYKHQDIQHEKCDFNLEDLWIVGRMNSQNETSIDSLVHSEYLYKCNNCSIHFLTRQAFVDHIPDCDCNTTKTQCIVCDLVFCRDSISKHFKIHHEILKMKKEHFRIVEEVKERAIEENVSSVEKENVKDKNLNKRGSRELEEIISIDDEDESMDISNNVEVTDEPQNELAENTLSKSTEPGQSKESDNILSIKPLYSNYLFKCDTCAVHFMSENTLKRHVALNKHSSPKTNCGYCGLDFNHSQIIRHREVHHMKMKLFSKDFKIVLASESATPANNILYKCTLCNLHFVTEPALDKHKCEPDVEFDALYKCRCATCGLYFHLQGLQRHKYIHHKKMHMIREDFVIVMPRKDKNESTTGKAVKEHNYDNKPQKRHDYSTKDEKSIKYTLTRKYKSMLKMSYYKKCLYKCSECYMHFMSCRTLESHRCQNKAPVTVSKCSSCNLCFTGRSLAVHQYIHHEKMGLVLEDLQILNEAETRILQKNGPAGDASIDPMKVDDHSAVNANDDENLVDFGNKTQMTNVSTASSSIGETSLENSRSSQRLRSCRLLGSSRVLLDYMELDNNSSISTLSDENSIDPIGEKSEENPKKSKVKSCRSYTLSAAYKSSIKLSAFSSTLYKCDGCAMHYLDSKSLLSHMGRKCDRFKNNAAECPICGLKFTFVTIEKHKYIHHEKLHFKREDMKVVCGLGTDSSEIKNTATDSPISKTGTIEEVISGSLTSKTRKDVPQDADELENEMPISESTMLQSDTVNTKIIMDDSDDDVIETSASVSNKLSLTKSRLNISKPGKDKKIDTNTSKPTVVAESTSSDDIQSSIDEVNSNKASVDCDATGKTKYKVKLYKCGECNVYFMTQSTCYKHTIKHKPIDNLEFIDCKLCGLAFRILSLHKHMSAHHKKEFNLEDVLIEEYQPNSQSSGIPKIDIYYAIDQSKLISTTSDVSSKDINTTEVKQSKIVMNSPKNAENTQVKNNSQEIDAKNSNTDIQTENVSKCQDKVIIGGSAKTPTPNTDKEKVTEKLIDILPESQSTEKVEKLVEDLT